MVEWGTQQKEQFDSLMEDYKLVAIKLEVLDKEGNKVLEEMMRIQMEMQLLYKKVCK